MGQSHHKPRRTAMWILIILGSLLLLAVIGFIYSVFFEVGSIKKPVSSTPGWDEAKYRSPKNPYRHYEAAMRLLPQYDADILSRYYQQTTTGTPPDGQQPVSQREVEISLANVAPAIDEVMAGAKCSVNDFQFVQKPASFKTLFPEFSNLRSLARAVLVDANYKMEQRKPREAVEEYLALVHMGDGTSRAGGLLIGSLVGYAIKAMAYNAFHKVIGKQGLGAEEYHKIAKRLEKAEAERLTLREVMEGEYLYTRGALLEILQMGPKELEQMGFDIGGGPKVTFAYLSIPGMKMRTVGNFDQAWSTILEYAEMPYPTAVTLNTSQLLPSLDPISQQLIGDPKGLFRKNAEVLTLNRGIMLMAALEAFRLEKGQYPNALKDLVTGGYISKVPVDPFTDNKPFKYSKQGSKYLLYSIGPDLSDEGGRAVFPFPYYKIDAANRGDIVFSPGLNILQKPQTITPPAPQAGPVGRGGPGTRGSAPRGGRMGGGGRRGGR